MDWTVLHLLATPTFVLAWYAIGAAGALYVARDLRRHNTALKQAMKWAWPIIVLFFSVLGLALYFLTARAPGVGRTDDPDEKRQLHAAYERSMVRRVNGAVIHCVAGDGLGIMTAMVVARLAGLTFWQEFWFEYAVGFAFGWLIFQYRSMSMMTDSTAAALGMAFRAEFFSMLTVMGGMGAVMTFVTPVVVGAQPRPDTAAFWGFGMFGLLVGYAFTFPMNWMLVKVGWKHGMGPAEGALPARSSGARAALFGTMATLGALALVLVAGLTEWQIREPIVTRPAHLAAGSPASRALATGLREDLQSAADHLGDDRRRGTTALDAALRVAQVIDAAAPAGRGAPLADQVRRARTRLQDDDVEGSVGRLNALLARIDAGAVQTSPRAVPRGGTWTGVPVLNARGARVGRIVAVRDGALDVAFGGAEDVFGFWNVGVERHARLPAAALVAGPNRTIGRSWAALPTLERPSALRTAALASRAAGT